MAQSQNINYYFGSVKVKHFIDTNNSRLSNVGYPVSDNDAATKRYVDQNISSAGIQAGSGITMNGSIINVNSNLTHVTAIGNINTGTWSANTINVPYGGTGKSSFTPNKLIMGDGTNPMVSINELSFESNLFRTTCPVKIANVSNSTGIGSGGSFTTLGGASISGKVFIGADLDVLNNVNIQGNMTVGNINIKGSCNFTSVAGSDGVYTNSTITNLLTSNITSSNTITTNVKSTNITTTNFITSYATSSNILSTNISSSSLHSNNGNITDLVSINISTSTLSTPQINATNVILTNLTGSNLNILSSITSPNIISSSIVSTSINSTNSSTTSLTTNNLIVNTSSIFSNVTTTNLFTNNMTASSIKTIHITNSNLNTINITTSNITSTSASITNLTTNNLNASNITTSNFVSTNVTSTNNSLQNLISTNISSATLQVSGMSILTTVNANNLSAGRLYISYLASINNANLINITAGNLNNTNSSINNLNTTDITTSNIYVNNTSTFGTVGSINLSTGNIYSATTAFLNNQIANSSSISNLKSVNASCNNLTVGSIVIQSTLTLPSLSNTHQTTTNLLSVNLKSTNISSSTLQISGISIFGTVNSTNLSTGNLSVSSNSNLNNLISTNATISNIQSTNITTSNVNITNQASIGKTLNIGSNFLGTPSTTSGNMLHLNTYVFTDTNTPTSGIIPFWASNYFSNPTLTAQNTITTQKVCNLYVQGNPLTGPNQTIENSAALAIGYVNNKTGGNLSGQIILERNDGNWYGSIFTEQNTNRIVVANSSLSGGGGIGLYTITDTKITFANIPSATNITPNPFIEFSNNQSVFYSTSDSTSKTSGCIVISGGLGVTKNITCNTITPTSINASIKKLQDVDPNMTPSNGQSLVWNGTLWSSATASGGGGSVGPTVVEVYPMNLVMPIMTSNGPIQGTDGDYYISASSEFSSIYSAYKCLSSVTNPTDWATLGQTSDFWIKVRLPTSQDVRYVLLEGRINNEDPNFVTIQGSNDDTTYTDIYTNQTFTALNYNGYYSARIPDNSKNYTYYKFLFPSGSGPNPGLNMLRLFRYDNVSYSEGILDNSPIEGNGYFNSSIINGRWPMAFDLSQSGIVNIRAQITCYTTSAYVLRKFVMYINGSPFQNDGSTFVKQCIHQNIHTSLQTLEWTGSLPAGIHTLSFFVDGGTGIVFDTNDNIRVNVVKY